MAKKPTPPKIPRCLCRNWLHWLLQIASTSKIVRAMYCPTVETEMYFKARREYEINLILWKIENRTCTRAEWDRLRRWRHFSRRAGE